jgi:hypothetical protein
MKAIEPVRPPGVLLVLHRPLQIKPLPATRYSTKTQTLHRPTTPYVHPVFVGHFDRERSEDRFGRETKTAEITDITFGNIRCA